MKFGESKFVETALVQERTAMVDTTELSAVTIFAAENFLLSDLAVIAGMRSFTKQLRADGFADLMAARGVSTDLRVPEVKACLPCRQLARLERATISWSLVQSDELAWR